MAPESRSDDVESRWWYLVAAYPVAFVLTLPLIILAGLVVLVPAIIVGPTVGPEPVIGVVVLLGAVIFGMLFFALIIGILGLMLAFPIAIYLDAKAVANRELEWQPDPILYAILGILQLIVTPIIGIIVAIFYLFRRHQHIGIP